MYHFEYLRNRDQRYRDSQARLAKTVERIAKHYDTSEKRLKDFPAVQEYIVRKYPQVDVSHIKIYKTSAQCFEKNGFKNIGGCYIHFLEVILIKDKITTGAAKKSKFDLLLSEKMRATIEMEDILVHEMIHAVSAASRRMSNYTADEEEFVYTNCVEFYYAKGMQDTNIVNSVFLPFCVQDVTNNRKLFEKMLREAGCSTPLRELIDGKTLTKVLGQFAEPMVDIVLREARSLGQSMIDLYHRYGHGTELVPLNAKTIESRFQLVDFDADL